jgi:hypothetical protein
MQVNPNLYSNIMNATKRDVLNGVGGVTIKPVFQCNVLAGSFQVRHFSFSVSIYLNVFC